MLGSPASQRNQFENKLIDKANESPKENKAWIAFSFGACLCFTICNSTISDITNKEGPACLFYFASGSIVSGIVYHILKSCRNEKGKIWNDQNIIVQGKFSGKNLLGFICFMAVYLCI